MQQAAASAALFRRVPLGVKEYNPRLCSRKSRVNYAETKDCVTKPGVIPYRVELIDENGGVSAACAGATTT